MTNDDLKGFGNILVVDDTKPDRDLFKFLLGRANFVVETASDGVEALKQLEVASFDLVLCDYLMPNMNGYEFLRKVRQEPKFSHLIVIILTSDESNETKSKLIKAGANDFIHKGDSPDEIIARLRVHLSAHAANIDRKVLELVCGFADKISQPLSLLSASLDVLEEKAQTQLPEGQKEAFLESFINVNKQKDEMIAASRQLKKALVDIQLQCK